MKLNDASKKRIEFFINLFFTFFTFCMFITSEVYLAYNLDTLQSIIVDEYLLSICGIGFLVCFNVWMWLDFVGSTFYFSAPLFKKLFHKKVDNGESNE